MHGGQHLSAERKAELVATAKAMSQAGKGLTACDEGPGTIGDRFEKVGITNSEENRRLYRQMLFTVANGDQFLSGAILDPETVYQKTDDGVLFPKLLSSRGIVPGVKPHLKIYQLPGCKPGETVMQGLDSLAVRCKEYYDAGCRFAKWRSPLVIGEDGDISALAIQTNMDDLARSVKKTRVRRCTNVLRRRTLDEGRMDAYFLNLFGCFLHDSMRSDFACACFSYVVLPRPWSSCAHA